MLRNYYICYDSMDENDYSTTYRIKDNLLVKLLELIDCNGIEKFKQRMMKINDKSIGLNKTLDLFYFYSQHIECILEPFKSM